jgi:hypothetical protein
VSYIGLRWANSDDPSARGGVDERVAGRGSQYSGRDGLDSSRIETFRDRLCLGTVDTTVLSHTALGRPWPRPNGMRPGSMTKAQTPGAGPKRRKFVGPVRGCKRSARAFIVLRPDLSPINTSLSE